MGEDAHTRLDVGEETGDRHKKLQAQLCHTTPQERVGGMGEGIKDKADAAVGAKGRPGGPQPLEVGSRSEKMGYKIRMG